MILAGDLARKVCNSLLCGLLRRMGADPSKSALDANCRAHDVKNLFVTDGGPFVSQAYKNPTWTIMALSMRTSEFIAQERKRGTL